MSTLSHTHEEPDLVVTYDTEKVALSQRDMATLVDAASRVNAMEHNGRKGVLHAYYVPSRHGKRLVARVLEDHGRHG